MSIYVFNNKTIAVQNGHSQPKQVPMNRRAHGVVEGIFHSPHSCRVRQDFCFFDLLDPKNSNTRTHMECDLL
ncbi:hypothetical protein D3C74_245780 [compost metagenome]